MRAITRTLYTFDELSEKAQEKALEHHRDIQDFPFLGDDMFEYLQEMLAENKITYETDPDVYYSLSYSQGDGAMFTGTFEWNKYLITIEHSGLYYHENSADIDIRHGNNTPLSSHEHDKVFPKFKDLYNALCIKLRDFGYSVIEEENSKEYISDFFNDNGYEFYEEGTVYDSDAEEALL